LKAKSILAIGLLLTMAVLSLAQSRETGAIIGKVTDDQKNPLPGVSVTLTGKNLMGSRSALTDALGAFRFPALPPGEYSLKTLLQGFKGVVQENIRLTTTVSLNVELVMTPATVNEEITVQAKAPTVDLKSTESGSVTLSNEMLRNLPTSQFTSDIVNLAPGVNNDVAYGAGSGRGISWQMDGVGVGDPDGGTAWVFLDYNIIEEAKVMGVGLPAEYGNFTGVIFNLITKSGGNQFAGHVEMDYQGSQKRTGISSNWILPAGSFWGTENNSAYAADFPNITSPIESMVDANFHLGGPIMKDKLWFYAGLQWYNSRTWPTGFPYAQDYKQPRGFIKLTSQLTNKTSLSFSFENDGYDGTYRGANATHSPEATYNQIDPNYVLNLSLTHIFSPSTFVDVKFAGFYGYYNLEPRMGRDVNAHYYQSANPDDPTRVANMWYDNRKSFGDHTRYRYQVNASLTHYADDFIKGSHDFKFGVEVERSISKNVYGYTGKNHTYYTDYWENGYTGNYMAYQYNGYNIDTRMVRMEVFAQDSWQVTDRLNINLGLRFSQNWGTVLGQSGTVFNTHRLAPRIGLTYDLLGDKSTVLKAHYGQYTDGVYSGMFDRLNTNWSDSTYYAWNLDTSQWDVYKTYYHGNWSIDPNLKHPYMEQITGSLERELFKDTSFSITYIYRNFHNFIAPYNSLGTYETRTITPPAPFNQPYTVYSLTSSGPGNWVISNLESLTNLYNNLGITFNPYRKYSGLELVFNKRFSNRWQLMVSYVYSKTWGTIDNSGAYTDIGWGDFKSGPDPNLWINADGNVSSDPTHMVKVQGSYVLPFDIRLNAYFTAISGDTWTAQYRPKVYGANGRVVFFLEQRGSQRYPLRKNLDLRLEKYFVIAGKYQLGILFDVFNVFNESVINSWGTILNYDWYTDGAASTNGHDLYGLNLPRRARIGIRMMF
jgi:hypothetical protein